MKMTSSTSLSNKADLPPHLLTSSIPNPNQIFMEGIQCNDSSLDAVAIGKDLARIFSERYGDVTDVAVHGVDASSLSENIHTNITNQYSKREDKGKTRKRARPYAFITFAEKESVKRALIGDTQNSRVDTRKLGDDLDQKDGKKIFWKCVLRARWADTWRRRAYDPEIGKMGKNGSADETDAFVSSLVENKCEVDVVLQVNRSHLDRFLEYLPLVGVDTISISKEQIQTEKEKTDTKMNVDSKSKKMFDVKVVGIIKFCINKANALILLQFTNRYLSSSRILRRLKEDELIYKALNKAYVVSSEQLNPSLVSTADSSFMLHKPANVTQGTLKDLAKHIYNNLESLAFQKNSNQTTDNTTTILKPNTSSNSKYKEQVIAKVEAYPASAQQNLLVEIENLMDLHDTRNIIDIAPKEQTHNVNVIRIDAKRICSQKKGSTKIKEHTTAKEDAIGTYLWGVSEVDTKCEKKESTKEKSLVKDTTEQIEFDTVEGTSFIPKQMNEYDSICRAYYKLQEAFVRYGEGNPKIELNMKQKIQNFCNSSPETIRENKIAFDVGAAPGGWTKYILEQTCISEVYSVDPAILDEKISSMKGVQHLRMKMVEKAIPFLRDKKVKAHLYVSDMCLPQVSMQVDCLLAAKNAGILAKDMLFVLTIKCNRGHSKEYHDVQTREEVNRLSGIAYGISVIHLFSNRKGERTIVGFMK